MTRPDVEAIERALRSLRCATDHLLNARENPAFDDEATIHETLSAANTALAAALDATRQLYHKVQTGG